MLILPNWKNTPLDGCPLPPWIQASTVPPPGQPGQSYGPGRNSPARQSPPGWSTEFHQGGGGAGPQLKAVQLRMGLQPPDWSTTAPVRSKLVPAGSNRGPRRELVGPVWGVREVAGVQGFMKLLQATRVPGLCMGGGWGCPGVSGGQQCVSSGL